MLPVRAPHTTTICATALDRVPCLLAYIFLYQFLGYQHLRHGWGDTSPNVCPYMHLFITKHQQHKKYKKTVNIATDDKTSTVRQPVRHPRSYHQQHQADVPNNHDCTGISTINQHEHEHEHGRAYRRYVHIHPRVGIIRARP
ncbi:unnamed protein product [Ectocarpus sp. 6 AP-2014]